jgi:hypothetical protein
VNPGSGPGHGHYPNFNYTSCVTKLHEEPNAHLLSNISTQYTKWEQKLVEGDIAKYADWATWEGGDIHMDGMFFDGAPSQFNEMTEIYMREISACDKKTLPDGRDHVTLNPGVICDLKVFEMADEVVVREDGYAMFGRDILRFIDAALKGKASVVVYGFNRTGEELGEMVQGLASEGFWGVYITTEGGYTGWGTLGDAECGDGESGEGEGLTEMGREGGLGWWSKDYDTDGIGLFAALLVRLNLIYPI